MEPTIVTSSPSSTQATPSAMTTRQCQGDHGSRSSRAGIVLYVLTETLSPNGLGHASPRQAPVQSVVRAPARFSVVWWRKAGGAASRLRLTSHEAVLGERQLVADCASNEG